jgi:hypothetical protein
MKNLLAALVVVLMGQGFAVAQPPVAAKSLVGQLPALDGSELQNLSAGNITPGGTLPVLSGANLTNLPPSVEGNTFASSKTFTSDVLSLGSVTASGLFGDGAGLTNLPDTETNTFTSSKTFTSDVLVVGEVTASTFNAVGSAYQMNGTTFLDHDRNFYLPGLSVSASQNAAGTNASMIEFYVSDGGFPPTVPIQLHPIPTGVSGNGIWLYVSIFPQCLPPIFTVVGSSITVNMDNGDCYGNTTTVDLVSFLNAQPSITALATFTYTSNGAENVSLLLADYIVGPTVGGAAPVAIPGSANLTDTPIVSDSSVTASAFLGDGVGLTNLPNARKFDIKTKAEFDALTPALGDTYYCSDCTVPMDICTGTAPVLSGFRAVINSLSTGALVPRGCGTDE